MSLWESSSAIYTNNPSRALLTSFLGTGGSPLLIRTGVSCAAALFDTFKSVESERLNSLMWSRRLPLGILSRKYEDKGIRSH